MVPFLQTKKPLCLYRLKINQIFKFKMIYTVRNITVT